MNSIWAIRHQRQWKRIEIETQTTAKTTKNRSFHEETIELKVTQMMKGIIGDELAN